MLIIADDKIPFLKEVIEPFADIEYYPGNKITQKIVKRADALIVRTRTRCNSELLDGTSIKFIATATIGFDHIDISYCKNKGIVWTNAAGCNSGSVMQYITAAILNYAVENNINLKERVLGVIGAGNIGKKVVKFAECIGMSVVINDPPRARSEGDCGFISIEGILREADIISLHVPLNYSGEDNTFHIVNDSFLTKVNKGSLLINTSRGEVNDTQALKRALNGGRLSAAILDVWENEPNIDKGLLESAFLATPHIAGYSIDGKSNATAMAVNAISRFFNLGIDDWVSSEIPEPVNKNIYYEAKNKSLQEIFTDLVKYSYDIRKDDKALRTSPVDFEHHRENYPFRREFGAYQMHVKNLSVEDKSALIRIGFKIL